MKYSCHVYNNFIWFCYDFIRTNPDWRCFQQNYHGVVFCAEIKVLGMGCKFTKNIFGKYKKYRSKKIPERSPEAATSLGGAPPRARLLACGPLGSPPDLIPTPKNPINIETSRKKPRSGVPPPQASVATKNQSRPRSSTLPEGEIITEGHLHHPGGLHVEEGLVHPRGWG